MSTTALVKFSSLSLMELRKKEPFCQDTGVEIECAICYQRIHVQKSKLFVCAEPCNKVFHSSCLARMIDQLEDSADQEEADPHYRCCYCRREFDINYYCLNLVLRELMVFKANGYCVADAVEQAKQDYLALVDAPEKPLENYYYHIETIISSARLKKPKQSKHSMVKQQKNQQFNKRRIINGNKPGKRSMK